MAAAAAPLRVAVAGAGPSGLAFAGALLREARAEGLEVSVAVVERWQRHRDQGSGWDVRVPQSWPSPSGSPTRRGRRRRRRRVGPTLVVPSDP